MKIFKITKRIEVVCESESTRYGFRHLATLFFDGSESVKDKCCYYNRTWEKYEFQSVLFKVVEKAFKNKLLTDKEKEFCNKFIDEGKEALAKIESQFKTIGMVAQLGDIFCKDIKTQNDWKERMLKAGLGDKGLQMPEDWETLDEDTKKARLDSVIKVMKEKKVGE